MSRIDKAYFARAAAEVAAGSIDQALYIKALATSHGEEVKARALYVALRAEELQMLDNSISRQNTNRLLATKFSGLGRTSIKLILALCSLLLVPGAGQLLSGRFRRGAIFLALTVLIIALVFITDDLLNWVDYDSSPVLIIIGMLLNAILRIWSAVDAFRGIWRDKTSDQVVAANNLTKGAT